MTTPMSLDETDSEVDPTEWLNQALDTLDEEDDASQSPNQDVPLPVLDQRLGLLLARLDAACADTQATVDKSIAEIATSIPRLSFDLQLMREHALLLRFTLDSIRKRSHSVFGATQAQTNGSDGSLVAISNPTTSQVMDNLAILDKIKTRMESARDVLREAEAWATLDAEVGSHIQEQAFGRAADRLAEAARSISVFHNTPEYEARRALMVSLQNSLETHLSVSLKGATAARDVAKCKTYFGLFAQIEREQEFRNYYFSERRNAVNEQWRNVSLSDGTKTLGLEPNRSQSLAEFLEIFFDNLARILEEERSYVNAIFPDPLTTHSTFLQTLLDGLEPSFHQRLSDLAEHYRHSHNALPQLIRVYRLTSDFGLKADRVLATLHDAAATPDVKQHHKSLSHRQSMSFKHSSRLSMSAAISSGLITGAENTLPRPWEASLFEPLLDWQTEYGRLESVHLSASNLSIQNAMPAALDWLPETDANTQADKNTRKLWEQLQACVARNEEALERCLAFTHGYAIVPCITAVDNYNADFITRQTNTISRAAQLQKARAQTNAPALNADNYLEILEYSGADWVAFDLAVKLLGTCRQLAQRVTIFEGSLAQRVQKIGNMLGEITAKDTAAIPAITNTTRGAIALLKQSTLYSAEFHALIQSQPSHFLPQTHLALVDFTKTSQTLLHDTILGPLLGSISNYASLPDWSAQTKARDQVKGAFNLNMPTFSVSPTEHATRFGEGLFNLPRLFEIYAEDDALAYSLHTLPYVQAKTRPMEGDDRISAETVVHTWLNSLTSTCLANLTDSTLPKIHALSAIGSAQLSADLAHISNVAKAYDVENAALERWRECTEMSDAEGRKAVLEASGVDDVLDRVARLRKWVN